MHEKVRKEVGKLGWDFRFLVTQMALMDAIYGP